MRMCGKEAIVFIKGPWTLLDICFGSSWGFAFTALFSFLHVTSSLAPYSCFSFKQASNICLSSWRQEFSLLYSVATLCPYKSQKDGSSDGKSVHDRHVRRYYVHRRIKIHACLHPHCSWCKAACAKVWGHERSNMPRFAHLYVWVVFEPQGAHNLLAQQNMG